MEMNFTMIGNATWVLDIDGKIKVGCDPALASAGTVSYFKGMKISRVIGPVHSKETLEGVGVWLLTHNHFDHLDARGVAAMERGSRVYTIDNCRTFLKGREGGDDLQVTAMKWHDEEKLTEKGYNLTIRAIPAFHGKGIMGRLVGGRVNGYVLTIKKDDESRVVYITADTIYTEEVKAAVGSGPIDLMIANMGRVSSKLPGGPYTLDLPQLERFEAELKPKTVLPVHIDDYSHFETAKAELRERWRVLDNGESLAIA